MRERPREIEEPTIGVGVSKIMNGDDLALAAVANTESQSLTAAAGHVVEKHTIKKSCDFCVKRKRHCDGYGLRRCR